MWTVFWTAIGLIVFGALLGTTFHTMYADGVMFIAIGILLCLGFYKIVKHFS